MLLRGVSAEDAEVFNAQWPRVIFLHGTMGMKFIATGVRLGLEDAGLEPDFEEFPWNWGLVFFFACTTRHAEHIRRRARELARRIVDLRSEHPDRPVHLIAQSGGCNVIRWALEALPPSIQVENVVMLSPSIAASVDMGKALEGVAGRLYYTQNRNDGLVLGVGTSLIGTPDRDFGPSAGHVGFKKQYPNMVAVRWRLLFFLSAIHFGDHAGGLNRRFNRYIVSRCLAEKGFDPERL